MACDWPVDETCLPALPDEADPGYEAAQAAQDGAKSLAVSVLWALSGRQFGICTYTARPCPNLEDWRTARYSRMAYGGPFVVMWDGVSGGWLNCPCGCLGRCEITNPRTIHLPGPVVEIDAVTIDGVVIPDTQYVLEGDVLYRRDYDWPSQDLSRPLGDQGTWSVEYERGQEVPYGVDRLTGALAKEFLSACSGEKCRLPRTVVSTTRSGVTHVFDPTRILAAGKTGLAEVDLWLSAVNPHRLLAPPTVF